MYKKIEGLFMAFATTLVLVGCGKIESNNIEVPNEQNGAAINIINTNSYDELEFAITPAIPKEYSQNTVIENYINLEYEVPMTFDNIVKNFTDAMTTVKVENISYTSIPNPSGGARAWTIIKASVVENIKGHIAPGTELNIYMCGGYISMRDKLGDILYREGGKYGDNSQLTESEINDTVFYEIINEGKLPVIGQEYVFCLAEASSFMKDGDYELVGGINGMLLKDNNTYLQIIPASEECSEEKSIVFSYDDLVKLID